MWLACGMGGVWEEGGHVLVEKGRETKKKCHLRDERMQKSNIFQ